MRIVVVGEGMIELSRAGAQDWRLGHGGDTLNTAIHLARMGRDVRYVTALGDDPFSATLRHDWAGEGIDTSLIQSDPTRMPGLYAITTDAAGERSFAYWRGQSAARRTLSLPGSDAVLAEAEGADLLLFSLITMAILEPEGQDRLIALAERVRARGGRVAFDGNYRPRLFPDQPTAQAACRRAIAVCDIGLPTLEDETMLEGTSSAEAVQARWHGLGAREVVVKLGAEGCLLASGLVPPPERLSPRDTSGAGDAFNAGYLAARLDGLDPAEAALRGHRLAGWTVMRPGAIPPRDADMPG
ncbi:MULTISPECIES: sugar kinase [unclassified Sphingomonas]|uniref:sugar kinase n=1 Tax=unclassified Sphingomonas TaxID=196159 RepID=UPI002861BC9A|nr:MULTISPECIES: sugar kinase [unclassified Sphingomonas]MDR6114767.1 2-dehydro-3-deoxygluconokinase [Sphingomonas sp. SORGH_AS_0789]MDR6151560.1 2-dehydro-3-deoxygluconokinase [Sphingomonas sp. SORGH_AS_0742]